MSWRPRLSVEMILRLTPAVLGEGTLDDRSDESAAPANPPLQRMVKLPPFGRSRDRR